MDPDRYQKVKHLCQSALDFDQGMREAYLKEACAGDESLRKEVEALLAHQTEAERFMKDPAMDLAAKELAEDAAHLRSRDLIGRSVAHYRIVEKIGEGGMGEVFLADDTSLRRRVALKFLPAETHRDPLARKRFLREAHSAASLNHPFICSIHQVGEHEGEDFIVMEYVDGDTLKNKLAHGPLPLKDALQIAIEIAEALEAAHGKTIIHRDIKPSNIMITKAGHAKVMDFGLAKQLVPPGGIGSQEATITAPTRDGPTVGTLAYMSPEQLRADEVDLRSDVFSFGIVLYEMLAGVHPFMRHTGAETISAILKDVPRPLGSLRRDTPVDVEQIIGKMLSKDPHDRYASIHDVRMGLKEVQEGSDRPPPEKKTRLKPLFWMAVAALVVVAAGIGGFLIFVPREPALLPPKIAPATTSGGEKNSPSLSHDGSWVAFQWNGEKQDNFDIYVQEVGGLGINRLTSDSADDAFPVWSPDDRQIAFARLSGDLYTLYLISPLGGGERKVAEVGIGQLSWSPDGKTMAYVDRKSPKDPWSIWSISLGTLEKKQITVPDAGCDGDMYPAFSPDGRYLAFARRFEAARSALYLIRLSDGEPKLVTDQGSPTQSCWTADSRELVFNTYGRTGENALWRISLGGGEPRRIPARGEVLAQPTVGWNRLGYISTTDVTDIWRLELSGQAAMKPPSKPLISWSSWDLSPRISPEGRRIAFASSRSGSVEIWKRNADGTGPLKLTDMKGGSAGRPSWSPDGRWIAFDSDRTGNSDIYVVGAEGAPLRQLTADPAKEVAPRWSRDGRWIYFGSNRSGNYQIWRMPSDGGNATQITREGGLTALESADGQFVYFYGYYFFQRKGIWRVPASGGPEILALDKEIYTFHWDLTKQGIYFIDQSTKPVATVCFYDFATGLVRSLAPVHYDPGFRLEDGLSVSPDGKWLLYCGGVCASDVVMIDNFR
jgi:eukaryotic-like serine/threonine-protein kinase